MRVTQSETDQGQRIGTYQMFSLASVLGRRDVLDVDKILEPLAFCRLIRSDPEVIAFHIELPAPIGC